MNWKKLETFYSIYFHGKSHFQEDGTENCFVFQPIHRYFKIFSANDTNILSWKSKGLSDQSIKAPTTPNKVLNRSLDYAGSKIRVKLRGDCLKQEKITFNHGKIANIYIVYEIEESVNISSYPTLENCLFGAVKLTKHVDIDLYKYSGYGIGFDRKGSYSIGNETGRNVIIFGVDMSLSAKIDNRKKDILFSAKVLHKEKSIHSVQKNCILLTLIKKKQSLVWVSIIMEQIVIYLLMVQKLLNSKQKILKLIHMNCA